MRPSYKKILILIAAFFFGVAAYASGDSAKNMIHGIAIDFRPGAVLHSNNFLSGENEWNKSVDVSLGMHLKYRFSYDQSEKKSYQGIGFCANTFCANRLLGSPLGIYVFQGAPIYRFSSRLSLGYEWNFGAMFGWKKYDEESNPQNISIGSSATAYINLGLLLHYSLSKNWQLNAGVEVSHYSNGNTSWPNSGVNTLSGRLGVAYLFNAGTDEPALKEEVFKPHWSLDVMAFAAPRKKVVQVTEEPQLLKGLFLVTGLNIAPMYNFNKYLAAGVSVDAQYNESAGLQDYWVQGSYGDNIKFYRPPFHKQISAGLSARVEFIMPIFTINAGIGQYLIGPSETRRTYQTLNLKTFIAKGIYLHVGYQLCDFKYPENLKLGVGYKFRLN